MSPNFAGRLTAGVDEAGRGPLAGPVVVAAVILDPAAPIDGLDDSKRLDRARRESLFGLIRERAACWSIVEVHADEIDRLNILQATLLGMARAVAGLDPAPDLALVDGNRAPALPCAVRTIVQGDRLEKCISAASILAKVHRDALMRGWHQRFPEYGFDRHKGYPTRDHLRALARHGPCPLHRRSFAPVREAMQEGLPEL
ncbi:MAG: ribonuclease HII [Lysobacterales bacterium]|jgi:ribonuclease HII